jgi:hypothetical protein
MYLAMGLLGDCRKQLVYTYSMLSADGLNLNLTGNVWWYGRKTDHTSYYAVSAKNMFNHLAGIPCQ